MTTEYSNPVFPGKVILERLQQLHAPMTQEALEKPQAHLQEVLDVFAKLVEMTTLVTREEMSQPVFAGLNVLNYAQLHEDSVPQLAFFRAVSKMMAASCVPDFCFNDLLAPNKHRLRKHLSAVINFCLFRENRWPVYNDLATNKENLLASVLELQQDNVRLERELAVLTDRTSKEAEEAEVVEADCRAMQEQIKGLHHDQAAIKQQSGELKRHSHGLKARLEALSLETREAQLERERLMGQIVSSPDRIRREMVDQQAALEQERAEAMAAHKQAQRVELTASGLGKAEREVHKATRALEEVEEEVARQIEALREVRAAQRVLADNATKSQKTQVEVVNLQRQAARFEEKLNHLRRQGRAKGEASDASLANLEVQLSNEEAAKQARDTTVEEAEDELQQLRESMAQEQAQATALEQEMTHKYKELEQAVLQYHMQIAAAMQDPLLPAQA